MGELIATGIGYGLLLSVLVGPAFFVLIETSITKGIRHALFFDLGVILADLIYLSIAYIFFSEVTALMNSENSFWLKIIGGGFFIGMGLMNVFKKRPKLKHIHVEDHNQLNANNYFMMVLKGVLFNIINIGVLAFWLTVLTVLPEAPPHLGLSRQNAVLIYIIIILIIFVGVDVLKIIGAKKLKEVLTPQWMNNLNLALGIVLICFGLLFLAQGLMAYAKG
ncbi:MAG: LysE family transporter [Crocinitomicaceae bacterium]